MKNYRQFNLAFFGLTIPGLLAVGLFNIGIDPYGVMNSPEWRLNRLRTEQFNHVRLFKATSVTRIAPKTVLLGSSRTDLGLDPKHPALAKGKPAYNLGLVGPNMYEVKRYFDHAIANQPELQTVVLGVDFFMFNEYKTHPADFEEARLERENLTPKELLNVTLSLGVTRSSLGTIKNSWRSQANFLYHDNGFRYVHNNEPDNPLPQEFKNMIRGFFREEGYYPRYKLSQGFLNDLRELVEICQSRNIDLKIFISPSHATQWEALRMAGHWNDFEQWKRELVAIAPVWDFSGYHSISTEPISENMTYYWDSSHYRQEVGNLILNRLFDHELASVPADFGVLTTPENVEEHLVKIQRDRESWANANPEAIAFVEELKP